MDGSPPNFHKMDSRSAYIQDVLKVKVKVKGHVIRALSWFLGMSYSGFYCSRDDASNNSNSISNGNFCEVWTNANSKDKHTMLMQYYDRISDQAVSNSTRPIAKDNFNLHVDS